MPASRVMKRVRMVIRRMGSMEFSGLFDGWEYSVRWKMEEA